MIKNITISVISHHQINLVEKLLFDIEKYNFYKKIIITINKNENIDILNKFKNLPIQIIKNRIPKGFGENHNFAFKNCDTDYFLIINPDVRINKLNIKNLLNVFKDNYVYTVTPIAINTRGIIQDNARKFPKITDTIFRIFKKNIDYINYENIFEVDWISGMFMLFKSEKFRKINGFDENFFLYYEDVDICKRINILGGKTIVCKNEKVIHVGQRMSHSNINYFLKHVRSLLRYHFKNYGN